ETVVKVDEMRLLVAPENVAGVAVAVQPDAAIVAGPLEGGVDTIEQVGGQAGKGSLQVRGKPLPLEQPVDGFAAALGNGELAALRELSGSSDCMHAPERAAQYAQRGLVRRLGRVAAAPGKDRQAEADML